MKKTTKKTKSTKKKTQPARAKKATTAFDWKAFSQHILQDYALPMKRIVEQKITGLQRRWAQI